MKRLLLASLVLSLVAISVDGQRQRYAGITATPKLGTDLYSSMKTIIKTISIDDDASVDDFQFDDDQINVTEQTIDFGAIIPAYAEIVSAQIRCIEAYVSTGANPDNITSLDLGITTGAGDILATATTDDLNDINATAAGAGPEVASTNAARNVWLNLVPEDNFNTVSAGRWTVIITYLDYGAVYTKDVP